MSPTARALSFDLDGTLLDGRGNLEATRLACAEVASLAPGLNSDRLVFANAEAWRGYWPEVETAWALGELSSATVSRETWRRALQACGFDDETLVRLARETHLRHQQKALRLFDDAEQVLASLASRLPLCLVTNGAADTQRDALRLLGIADRFSAVVISAEIGVAKPDKAIFHEAAQRLGVPSESVWHVGDNLATDVGGARVAGLAAIWLNRSGKAQSEDPVPDYEIRSLSELPALLA